MIDFLKKILLTKFKDKMVSVLKYPDKFIIETYYKTDVGIYVRSCEISVLPINISDLHLGQNVLRHLNLTKSGIIYKKFDHKKSDENYKKITRLKTIKMQMENCKNLSIVLNNGVYKLIPNNNSGSIGKNKGYTEILESEKIIDNLNDKQLGLEISKMWQFCN